MSTENKRNYYFKDAELTVICNFVAFNLKRDLKDFTDFSPKFNEDYISSFESKIAAVSEVIEPKSETVNLKLITQRLYVSLNSLLNPINRIAGYIQLADLPVTATDFGLSALRKSVYKKDAEGLIKNLNLLIDNTTKYQDQLSAQGFKEDLIVYLASASASISADNQMQYEIISKRKSIAQNNLLLFNSIYKQLIEILGIGKILYKFSNPLKL